MSIDCSELAGALDTRSDRIAMGRTGMRFADYEPHGLVEARIGALLIPTHGFVGVTALTLAAAGGCATLRRHSS